MASANEEYRAYVEAHQTEAVRKLMEDMQQATKTNSQNLARSQHIRQQDALILSLLKLRQRSMVSQRDLAFMTGMSQSVIARIESGKGNPTVSSLLKIARALDADLLFYKD